MSNVSFHDTVFVDGDTLVKSLYIPNIFSPNGDGINDIFNIEGSCIDSSYLTILDRSRVIYASDKARIFGWDGTINGERVDRHIYIFHLFVLTCDGATYNIHGEVCVSNCTPKGLPDTACRYGNQNINGVYCKECPPGETPCD